MEQGAEGVRRPREGGLVSGQERELARARQGPRGEWGEA